MFFCCYIDVFLNCAIYLFSCKYPGSDSAYRPTSSPAVTERLRNTLCLSVVSLISTICRVRSSIISYLRFIFIAAYN